MPRCRAIQFDNEPNALAAAQQTAAAHDGEVQTLVKGRNDTTPAGYQAPVNTGTAKEPVWYALLTARWTAQGVRHNAKPKP